jgi:multiple sugar transport system permease protein
MAGIDGRMLEAAWIDGASPGQAFYRITLPLIAPVAAYVVVMSLIGGLQMFDVPQVLTNGRGSPGRTAETVVMHLNKHLISRNYGMAGAVSTLLFLVTAALCSVVVKSLEPALGRRGGRP